MMQDYFDLVIKFEMESKKGPAEAGIRLWQLIKKIPDANVPEQIATGFVISILSQCDERIRRELNSVVITTKNRLFHTLRGFTLKRKNEDPDKEPKRSRSFFPWKLPFLRKTWASCRRVLRQILLSNFFRYSSKTWTTSSSVGSRLSPASQLLRVRWCESCSFWVFHALQEEKRHCSRCCGRCNQRRQRVFQSFSVLQISGFGSPFMFHSGSECSLIKQSHSNLFNGKRFHEQVTLWSESNLDQSWWKEHLGDIQLALNSARCRVTGFTPIE